MPNNPDCPYCSHTQSGLIKDIKGNSIVNVNDCGSVRCQSCGMTFLTIISNEYDPPVYKVYSTKIRKPKRL